MNVVSYINGDAQITDFPATSARPLASFVQLCNDLLAGPDGYLSPEDGLLVLDLGWLTVGTADAAESVVHTWVSKLLISPPWGVARYARGAAADAIADVAELHRTFVPGETPSIAAWDGAARVARALSATAERAERYALRAAAQSTALIETDDWATLDAVTGNALKAHRLANAGIIDDGAARIIEVTRNAIRSWRRLAGLSVVGGGSVAGRAVATKSVAA